MSNIVEKIPNIIIQNSGIITQTDKATNSNYGIVKIDGTTITANDGTISATPPSCFGVCSTSSGIDEKVVIINGILNSLGTDILVKFENTNTASNVKLTIKNENNQTIYNNIPIYDNGSPIVSNILKANHILHFVYEEVSGSGRFNYIGNSTGTTYGFAFNIGSDTTSNNAVSYGTDSFTVTNNFTGLSTNVSLSGLSSKYVHQIDYNTHSHGNLSNTGTLGNSTNNNGMSLVGYYGGLYNTTISFDTTNANGDSGNTVLVRSGEWKTPSQLYIRYPLKTNNSLMLSNKGYVDLMDTIDTLRFTYKGEIGGDISSLPVLEENENQSLNNSKWYYRTYINNNIVTRKKVICYENEWYEENYGTTPYVGTTSSANTTTFTAIETLSSYSIGDAYEVTSSGTFNSISCNVGDILLCIQSSTETGATVANSFVVLTPLFYGYLGDSGTVGIKAFGELTTYHSGDVYRCIYTGEDDNSVSYVTNDIFLCLNSYTSSANRATDWLHLSEISFRGYLNSEIASNMGTVTGGIYLVTESGTYSGISCLVGDKLIYNGTNYIKMNGIQRVFKATTIADTYTYTLLDRSGNSLTNSLPSSNTYDYLVSVGSTIIDPTEYSINKTNKQITILWSSQTRTLESGQMVMVRYLGF